ncbi:hypothetical protein [Pseudostreptobacillus hongkongensis]|uniref:hypothetical protein n=1 Tax=Pseudostreptobacillus hongkongensis TaxID=1162717 RepID=UPI00082DC044|nr:hypothetical protein [Pseudostreptobacillus hongkongensis]
MDIYSGEYIGKYSVSEEAFVTESQLVDGKNMGEEVIDIVENHISLNYQNIKINYLNFMKIILIL